MEIKKVTREPAVFDSVQVTPQNLEAVAEWCKGTVVEANYRLMGGMHKMGAISLGKQGPKNNQTRVVLIGHWITKNKNAFRHWTQSAYEKVFTEVGSVGGLMAGDLVQAQNEIWAGWEGKVADPHLVGVDFGTRGMFVFEPHQVVKISEMDSVQLELNAGVEVLPGAGTPVEQVVAEMRAEKASEILAMEQENLADDEIAEGDMVEVLDATSPYFALHGTVEEIESNDVMVAGDSRKSHTIVDYLVQFEDFEGLKRFNPKQVQKVKNYLEPARIKTINEFREELGMRPLGANGEEPISEAAQKTIEDMTPGQREVFVETQKRAEAEIFSGGELPLAHMIVHENGEVEQLLSLDQSSVGTPNNADHPSAEFTPPYARGNFVEVVGIHNSYNGFKGNVIDASHLTSKVRLDMGPEVTFNNEDLRLITGGRPAVKQDDMVEVNKPDSPFFGSVGLVTVVGVCESMEGHVGDPCAADLVEVRFESHGQHEYGHFDPIWLKKV